ncbi:kinase-like domain-containing protein [Cyathus striatus]|nr:kinase-like domain-containing protein [Cyathus striatus]
MADEEQKQILFCQRGPSAQSLLDLFHMLLDHPGTNSALRSGLMVGTKHLCYRSSLYPRSFILKDIRWEERTLYAGGFGDILKGWFKDQEVCLKVVKVYANYDNDRLIRAFSKEAILWSHISHPNTLPFYGIFKHPYFESRICLVSPWMANGNINEYLRAHPEVNRHPLICDIAEGVKYLHQNGIIHGDLKGFNILINVYGRACIGDFGLSTIVNGLGLSGQWTSVATSIVTGGTLRWQAPELLNVDFPHVTKMSDIYAFACVCYEILTGKIPFYNILRDGPVILKIITGDRPSRPDDGSISDCIWELMELCWCQEPCERPQMEEVVDSLRVCPSVEKQEEESWGTLSSSSIRLAMHGPMKQMTAGELKEILSWL